MPELPEVETMVRGIRPQAEGRTILEMEFCACSRKPIQIAPAAGRFRKHVAGTVVDRVWRLAKRVVITLNSGESIVVEPRMTGLMLVAEPPTQEHRRICWHLKPTSGSSSSFEFWDRRGLGTVKLLSIDELQQLKNSLGPDALQITAEELRSVLLKTKRPVKVALLDQKIVAGIGNLYASEILNRAGVSPRRAGHRITVAQAAGIVSCTRDVLQEAIRYEGSTLGDGTYRNVLNQDGSYQNEHRVYQKEGEACVMCGKGTIRRIVQAQRSTFYCAKCQK